MILLGLDPGLAKCGWAIVDFHEVPEGHKICPLEIGTFNTEACDELSASEDNLRRAQALTDNLDSLISEHYVSAIGIEAFGYPPSAMAAVKMALCWGIVASLTSLRCIPVYQISPQALKTFIAGSNSASKDDVEAAVMRDPCMADGGCRFNMSRADRNHAFDALAVAIAILRGNGGFHYAAD